ncbi:Uncaracterized surface protein containing fasciclin (FAS1) repeats [Parapedobacter composti]|uniref:Uncaracterized surface protein containing fasciclin (FAS1) repeats n=1 Tax=Parapedobacter composti TaxID=623281 RepID=A0A1I1E0X5_9SPHI|nr:fasciclin domain-containing protein [Parapedobacter composti]SFB80919.1 Uncaracterized surface protein containing fasciclin (FAS1) repeats [Parapedobacter composti]
METHKKISSNVLALVFACLGMILGCVKENIVVETTEQVSITGYFEANPDKFSEFAAILDAANVSSVLNAYGLYTIFAPTNEGVRAYYQRKGKQSASDFTAAELRDLVLFHLLPDTIGTTAFTDGKLNRLTYYGQHLVTGVANVGGVSNTVINRQANLVEGNIAVNNGIIHAIDQVLEPATQTVAQLIESNPDLQIFARALHETGWYNRLNVLPAENPDPDSVRRWFTVLVEPDAVLAEAGFPTYEALRERFSHTGNPADPTDSLYLYVAYHVLPDARYLADIVSRTSHPTWAPLEVITSKYMGQEVLINDDIFNGMHEPGIGIDPAASDRSATNGVLHIAQGHFNIKLRSPIPVYWDLADQPEFRRLPGFRNGSLVHTVNLAQGGSHLEAIRWERDHIQYQANAGEGHFWGDRIMIPMSGTTNIRNHWVEFTTPLLVRGRYKVWVCYRTNPRAPIMQGYFNGVPLPRTLNMAEYNIGNTPEGEMEALGFKRHTNSSSNNFVGRLLGTIDVETTDRHILRFEGIAGGGDANGTWWDMIHFIPVDMDQLYPKFQPNGEIVQRPAN